MKIKSIVNRLISTNAILIMNIIIIIYLMGTNDIIMSTNNSINLKNTELESQLKFKSGEVKKLRMSLDKQNIDCVTEGWADCNESISDIISTCETWK